MAIKKRVKKQVIVKKEFLEKVFNNKYKNYIFMGLLFVIVAVFFLPMAFRNYVPQASDSMQWRGSAQSLIEYNKTHEDQALWSSNVFSGMPGYLISFSAKYPFINNLRVLTDKLINWRVFLLFTAGLGVYILMLSLGFKPMIAFISAIGFSLSCHFIGLIEIGHNTKFRAIVYLPWIFFALHYLKEKVNILGIGLLSLFIIGQLRENHPQISYYTFMMIGIYWIFQLIWAIKEKKVSRYLLFSVFLLFVVVVAFMAVAQPYLSTYEYGEYTIRGGAEGLETDYATSWSFHPLEMISFVIPNFFGGISPYYWGWMPFTQVVVYMGVVILLFALIAVFRSKSRIVKILTTVSIVTLFISFGRHPPFLSNFLLHYLPGFNKFRVPAMILVLLEFTVVVLAGYGIKFIVFRKERKHKKFFDIIQKILIAFVILFILFTLTNGVFEKLSLSKAGETAQYSAEQIKQLKSLRFDKLVHDGFQALIFIILTLIVILAFGRNKIRKYLFLFLIAILVITDLLIIDRRFLQNLKPEKQIETTFQKTKLDEFLLKDEEVFRIYPLGREFGQNRWCYFHQSIGGYHGAKLKRYQQIIENCLNTELKDRIPINWNIVNMLNTKYIIFNQNLPFENLEYAFHDRKQKMTVYKNLEYLPRAWFVENLESTILKEEIWNRLNQKEFDPAKTAIIEKRIENVFAPQFSKVELVDFNLHYLKFEVETDTTSFLTVSEIYYPAGWRAFIDETETEIYPTNYILRGVVVPKGKHILEMKFEPETYRLSLELSAVGLLTSLVFIILGVFNIYLKAKKGKRSRVFKK